MSPPVVHTNVTARYAATHQRLAPKENGTRLGHAASPPKRRGTSLASISSLGSRRRGDCAMSRLIACSRSRKPIRKGSRCGNYGAGCRGDPRLNRPPPVVCTEESAETAQERTQDGIECHWRRVVDDVLVQQPAEEHPGKPWRKADNDPAHTHAGALIPVHRRHRDVHHRTVFQVEQREDRILERVPVEMLVH